LVVGLLAVAIVVIVCWVVVHKRKKTRMRSALTEKLPTFSDDEGICMHEMAADVRQVTFESVVGASAIGNAFLEDDLDELL
jgi:hypothetical protein